MVVVVLPLIEGLLRYIDNKANLRYQVLLLYKLAEPPDLIWRVKELRYLCGWLQMALRQLWYLLAMEHSSTLLLGDKFPNLEAKLTSKSCSKLCKTW